MYSPSTLNVAAYFSLSGLISRSCAINALARCARLQLRQSDLLFFQHFACSWIKELFFQLCMNFELGACLIDNRFQLFAVFFGVSFSAHGMPA